LQYSKNHKGQTAAAGCPMYRDMLFLYFSFFFLSQIPNNPEKKGRARSLPFFYACGKGTAACRMEAKRFMCMQGRGGKTTCLLPQRGGWCIVAGGKER